MSVTWTTKLEKSKSSGINHGRESKRKRVSASTWETYHNQPVSGLVRGERARTVRNQTFDSNLFRYLFCPILGQATYVYFFEFFAISDLLTKDGVRIYFWPKELCLLNPKACRVVENRLRIGEFDTLVWSSTSKHHADWLAQRTVTWTAPKTSSRLHQNAYVFLHRQRPAVYHSWIIYTRILQPSQQPFHGGCNGGYQQHYSDPAQIEK